MTVGAGRHTARAMTGQAETPSRSIVIVTGTRADWGLLEPIARAVAAQGGLRLRVVVTGVHLTTGTWRDVRSAGFTIDARVRMQRAGEVGRSADAHALGRGVAGLAKAFDALALGAGPGGQDVVLVLGDRIEAMAAAAAASVGGRWVAHVHGGDRAQGVADEAMRHAVSKLAHWHFPATPTSRRRLIRMGERPEAVWCHGSPAVDALRDIFPAGAARAGHSSGEVIVLHHPSGQDDATECKQMTAILKATAGRDRLVLMPNHDPGRGGVVEAIEQHACAEEVVDHLPRAAFLKRLCVV